MEAHQQDRKQSNSILKLPLRPEKILVLAVLGCLSFCIYLAYTHHMGLLHTENMHSFAGGPIVKKSDLRGNSKKPDTIHINQAPEIVPIPTLQSSDNPDVVTERIAKENPISTLKSTILLDSKLQLENGKSPMEIPVVNEESIFASYLHDRYVRGSAIEENKAIKDADTNRITSVPVLQEIRKFVAHLNDEDPKFDVLLTEAQILTAGYDAEDSTRTSTPISDGDIIKNVGDLRLLLRYGSRCVVSNDIVLSKPDPRVYPALDVIQRLIFAQSYKSVLEISAIPTAHTVVQYLAEKHYRGFGSYDQKLKRLYETESDPTFLHSSFATEDQEITSPYRECSAPVVPNLIVTTPDNKAELFGNFDCLQYIDDISLLVRDQMPFEFERSFGLVLCRCNETVIDRNFPDDSFFAYWDSMEALIRASLESISDDPHSCLIEVDKGYRGTTSAFLDMSTAVTPSTPPTVVYKSSTSAMQIKSFDLVLKTSKYMLVSRSNTSTMFTRFGHLPLLHVLAMKLDNPSKLFLQSCILDTKHIITSDDWSSLIFSSSTIVSDKDVSGISKSFKKSLGNFLSTSYDSMKNYTDSEKPPGYGRLEKGVGVLNNEASASYNRYLARFGSPSDSVVKSVITNSSSTSSGADNVASYLSQRFSKSIESSRPNRYRRRLGTGVSSSNVRRRVEKTDILVRELKGSWVVSKSTNLSYFENDPFKSFDYENFTSEYAIKPQIKLRQRRNSAWLAGAERLQQLSIRERETATYQRWISVLYSIDSKLSNLADARLIYLFGSRISLLAVKLSKQQKKLADGEPSLTISILTNSVSVQAHEQLLEVMSVDNNIICQSELYLPQLSQLSRSSEIADYSIIQVDVILRLMVVAISTMTTKSSFDLFEEMLGTILSLSQITLVEMPSNIGLSSVLKHPYSEERSNSFFDQYLDGFSMLKSVVGKLRNPKSSSRSSVQVTIEEQEQHMDSQKTTIFKVQFSFESKSTKLDQGLISLHTLLLFNPNINTRRQLFKSFIDFPLWKYSKSVCKDIEISPSNIFVSLVERSLIKELYFEYEIGQNGLSLWYRPSCDAEQAVTLGATAGWGGIITDRKRASLIWNKLRNALEENIEDLEGGKFSFVEHKSGYGHLSALVAMSFPDATVISLEQSDLAVDYHVNMLFSLNITNNAPCRIPSDVELSLILKNLYETPELFRFQVFARDIIQSFAQSDDVNLWGLDIGLMLSTALTTFVSIPTDIQISLSKALFYGLDISDRVSSKALRDRGEGYIFSHRPIELSSHPLPGYKSIDRAILLAFAKTKEDGHTEVDCVQVSDTNTVGPPMLRCDILNMTRHVHHHYDYTKDGHTRTYTMHIGLNESLSGKIADLSKKGTLDYSLNENGVLLEQKATNYEMLQLPLGVHPNMQRGVSVQLFRDKDSFPIPYTSIYGVTLISAIRLGLDSRIRDRYFSEFLNLSLYEDMAPWNIVLNGRSLSYIDYDTRDITFDQDISKVSTAHTWCALFKNNKWISFSFFFYAQTYRLMSVLMNYKRTVEDFKKCSYKAGTVYNIAFISDCIGSELGRKITCPDLKNPVPCGDGSCHSDYISCLRVRINTIHNKKNLHTVLNYFSD